ncbi:MAG: ATP cone domain-containing protein [Candidatus Aenigmatarchaeota archaeon]
MPKVVKKDKIFEAFDPQKVFKSCVKAGVAEGTAREIAAEVERQVMEGMPTRLIRKMVLQELQARSPEAAEKYGSFDKHASQKIIVRCNYV